MAAEFDCFLASGIETGGEGSLLKTHLPQALIRKPFAYRPPRKINRVDVETKLARPTPTTNRAFCRFVHLRTGNLGYYRNISLNARFIFASYKNFSYSALGRPFPLQEQCSMRQQSQKVLAIQTPWIDNRREKKRRTYI
jgi:hypothetical protein